MNITIFLAGDVLITKRIPHNLPTGFSELGEFVRQHECCFGNLETTIHRREGYPEAFPGGSYMMSDPFCLDDLKRFGFNIFNTANNHSMDYGHRGLLATLRYLDKRDLLHCGTGKNLSDASMPTFFECKEGRVAFIGLTSSYHDSYAAGPQNQDMLGRPGVAPLRHTAVYELDSKNFKNLVEIADSVGINNYHNQARKEGYINQSKFFKFGTYNFVEGNKNRVSTTPLEADVERTRMSIIDAKTQADIVVVSIHSHQFKGTDKHNTPEFISLFSKLCIDAGADIVVGHGPHVMRGLEVYKNGLIFHGLGNFILQHETMAWIPEEQYNKEGLFRQTSTGVGAALNARSLGGKRGLIADKNAWISICASVLFTENKIIAELYPIEISKGCRGGFPSLSNNKDILKEIMNLSIGDDTHIELDKEKNIAKIEVSR